MRARLVKWEDGLGLPLSPSFAREVGWAEGTVVDLSLEFGNLIVRKIPADSICLEDLLAGVTKENIHEGLDAGKEVGGESW